MVQYDLSRYRFDIFQLCESDVVYFTYFYQDGDYFWAYNENN